MSESGKAAEFSETFMTLQARRNLDGYRLGRRRVIAIMIVIGLLDAVAIGYLLRDPGAVGVMHRLGLPFARVAPAETPAPTEPAASEEPEPPAPEPKAEPEPEAAPEPRDPAARELEFTHYVRWGDTFYTLARRYWDNEHLWPDLWSLNRERFPDPDFIAERDVVAIYPRLAPDGEFQSAELNRLFEAYLEAYRAYQRVGDDLIAEARRSGRAWQRKLGRMKRDKSTWLLYSALRFDEGYLDRYEAKIDADDLAVVRNYIDRFGIPSRR